jgi:parallel beta-helix repeat protein
MTKKHLYVLLVLIIFGTPLFGQGCNIQAVYSPPLAYSNLSNTTISGLRITNPNGHCLVLSNCNNITITNCIFANSSGMGIRLENCTNVTIQNCSLEKNSIGIYALSSQGIKVTNNKLSNSVGNSSLIGHLIQFDKVTGSNNEISYNVGEMSTNYTSATSNYTDDLISLYQSSGTMASPILVKGNSLRGGRQNDSSTGIIAGDQGGAYITIQDNILVDPGQVGIAVAGGTNIKVINNQVYARSQDHTNVGMYVHNYTNPCGNVILSGNQVNFTRGDCNRWPTYCNVSSPLWNDSSCTNVKDTLNNWHSSITASILPARILCPDLVVHYKFNNNTNEGNGVAFLNGVQSGGVTYACGNEGFSANFDGVNDVVALPLNDLLKPSAQKLSFAAWIFPTDFNRLMAVAHSQDGDGWSDGWRMIVDHGGLYARMITKNGTNTTAQEVAASGLTINQWNHVAFTYDGAALKLYINGSLVDNKPLTGDILYNAIPHYNNMRIGFSDGQNYFFKGRIDDVKFYRGALNDSEVMSEYSSSTAGYVSGATPPVVSISYSPSLNVCRQPVTLTASPANATSYTWYASGSSVLGTSQSLTVYTADVYTAYVFNGACSGSASVTVVSSGVSCNPQARVAQDNPTPQPAEMDQVPTVTQLTVYPNPASTAVSVLLPWVAKEDAPVYVYDAMGIPQCFLYVKQGEWKVQWDVQGMQDGVYLLRTKNKDTAYTTKLIIRNK